VVPATASPEQLRIISWNIDRGIALSAITAQLRRAPGDLLLLQEVDLGTRRSGGTDVAAALAHSLRLNAVCANEFEELSQEASGQAAYTGQVTMTALPVTASRILRFRQQSGFWAPRSWLPSRVPLFQRRLGSRMALVTELAWRQQTVVVYNAHLESRSYGRIQLRQIAEMLADAQRYSPATVIVLGGDLNSKYLPSIFLHRLEAAGYRSALGEQIERTHAIAMALDWIFVKGPVVVENGAVDRTAQGSDHFPVRAVVERGR
jgi:endonuclease/exonuclease/phosphatase family metal-dependent hydrolase